MVSDREVEKGVLVTLLSMVGHCLIISRTTWAHACSHTTMLIAGDTERQVEAEHGCARCRSLGAAIGPAKKTAGDMQAGHGLY